MELTHVRRGNIQICKWGGRVTGGPQPLRGASVDIEVSANQSRRLLPKPSPVVWLAVGVFVLLVAVALSVPMLFTHRRRQYPLHSIRMNLLVIDSAKQTWALANKTATTNTAPVWDDLLPYLCNRAVPKAVIGERYEPGRVFDRPQSVLTRNWEGHPKGTIVRLSVEREVEYLDRVR